MVAGAGSEVPCRGGDEPAAIDDRRGQQGLEAELGRRGAPAVRLGAGAVAEAGDAGDQHLADRSLAAREREVRRPGVDPAALLAEPALEMQVLALG